MSRGTPRKRGELTPAGRRRGTSEARHLVGGVERVAVGELLPHPRNPRRGNVDAIAESLRVNGQYAPLVVQRSTGHILAGNHTHRAAQMLGWTEIDVVYVDVSDDAALRILLSANRTADLATYDDELLADMLAELAETPAGFEGTLFDGLELDKLLLELGREEDLGKRIDITPADEVCRLLVTCRPEDEQAVRDALGRSGVDCEVRSATTNA